MRPRGIGSFPGDQSGAISPLYAIVLLVLIALAGVGFDYGRLMAMQSELQNAADQAALAAATQLDGRTGAMERARSAASEAFTNETRVSNDGEGRGITDFTVTFYDGYADDQVGNVVAPGGDDADAAVVRVSVNGRGIFYALTPVVGAISREGVTAHAMAMLKQASCNTPPIMVCVDRDDFPLPADEGLGLRMRWKSSSDLDGLAPGNWGFLNVRGEKDSQYELGENTYNACVDLENVITEPGFRNTEPDALNTRFDMPKGKLTCQDNGDFCPAEGVRKNRAIANAGTVTSPNTTLTMAEVRAQLTCPASVPTSKASWTHFDDIASINRPAVNNFRLDNCFYNGTCSYLGNGEWDIDAYLAAHHPGVSKAIFTKGSRYEVYQWELEDPAHRMAPAIVGFDPDRKPQKSGANYRHAITYYCAYPQPKFSAPLAPSATQKDRRILTVAAAKCRGVSGRKPIDILAWMDVFILEPSEPAEPGTILAEVIGPALKPGNLSGFQYYGKGRAVLIR